MSTRRTEIDALIAALQEYVGDLDRTAEDNRRAAWTLICRARKRTEDPVGAIIKLIDTVFSGHPSMAFHAKNLTSLRYIVNNGSKISNEIRSVRASSPAAKGAAADDYIRSRYGGATVDDPSSHKS